MFDGRSLSGVGGGCSASSFLIFKPFSLSLSVQTQRFALRRFKTFMIGFALDAVQDVHDRFCSGRLSRSLSRLPLSCPAIE